MKTSDLDLPLTNKHLFTPIHHHRHYLVEQNQNEEYIWALSKHTEHVLIVNGNAEGIRIRWEDNPFDLYYSDGSTLEYRREF